MPKKSEKVQEVKVEEKPVEKPKKLSSEEYENKVLELAKQGLTAEKIGENLRKSNIHPKEYTKISRILKKHKSYVIPDIKNISEKLEKIKTHIGKMKQDKRATRDKDRIFAQLRKLKEYHQVE